jgi:hypothetical protein
MCGQEISVHGSKSTTASCGSEGQDAGHTKDVGHCEVSEDKKSMAIQAYVPKYSRTMC